jgi:hypothetical protein
MLAGHHASVPALPPSAACANVTYMSPVTNMTYVFGTCGVPYKDANAQCQHMGGLLTSWATPEEQTDVEQYFISKVGPSCTAAVLARGGLRLLLAGAPELSAAVAAGLSHPRVPQGILVRAQQGQQHCRQLHLVRPLRRFPAEQRRQLQPLGHLCWPLRHRARAQQLEGARAVRGGQLH